MLTYGHIKMWKFYTKIFVFYMKINVRKQCKIRQCALRLLSAISLFIIINILRKESPLKIMNNAFHMI